LSGINPYKINYLNEKSGESFQDKKKKFVAYVTERQKTKKNSGKIAELDAIEITNIPKPASYYYL
jgi:hypothetical protein